MIRDPGLRVVVSADLFGSVACADHGAAGGIKFFLTFLLFHVIKAGPQDGHGAGLVLQLGSFVLAGDDHSGGNVDQPDSSGVLLNVLTAGTCGFVNFDADIGFRDLDIKIFHFRKNCNRDRGSVDAALGLGDRYTLDPVSAGFKLQPGVSTFTFDHEGDFLVSADSDLIFRKDLNMPAAGFRIMGVHAEKVCRKQCRFIAAGTGTDLNDDIFGIPRVLGDQQGSDLLFQLFDTRFVPALTFPDPARR